MKKPVTYRELTVAIGIIVAMVVAITMWVAVPANPVSKVTRPATVSTPLDLIGNPQMSHPLLTR